MKGEGEWDGAGYILEDRYIVWANSKSLWCKYIYKYGQ